MLVRLIIKIVADASGKIFRCVVSHLFVTVVHGGNLKDNSEVTAGLYGDGKNFAKTMLRIAENNNKVRVVCDQIGTPTSTLELTKGIDSLLFSDNYGLFHATCEGKCSWADFAKEVFRLAGKEMEVEYVTTAQYLADYPQQAARPANSVLENYMFKMTNGYMFASWEDAIKEYMKTIV